MEREEARRRAEVMMAFANGSDVQFYNGSTEQWEDLAPECVLFDSKTEYRIKPEPKYRPFKTQEECWNEMLKHQPFGWIKHKTRREYAHIDGLIRVGQADFVRCLTIERYDHEFYNMFKNYTFLDGVPFGIKEE